MVEILEAFGDRNGDVEAFVPLHEFGAPSIEERVLEAAIRHELVDEEELAAAAVGGEAEEGEDERRVEVRGEREFVVELTFSLERTGRVHELERDGLAGREGCLVDRAEAAVAEFGGRGEGVGGAAEEGVGEAAVVVVVGIVVLIVEGGGAVVGELTVEENCEGDEEREEDECDGGGEYED